jgi:GT2 family glycosyltransferase/glycosyltransferase involved in cell wall biosynthesis
MPTSHHGGARRILIISHDIVGPYLAGPGIRYRELARVLAQESTVTLATPGEARPGEMPFETWSYSPGQWNTLAPAANRADVIVACGDTLAQFPALSALGTPLVVDGYDPHTLEGLAMWAGDADGAQVRRHEERLSILRLQCRAGDFFICASERQRDWWLGLLEQQGRINPRTYAADPSLRQLIDVVPYGLPSQPARATGPVLSGVWPGVSRGDRILLWGGGLWAWLDPLTAVRAVRRLVDHYPEVGRVRLVFPGTRHPNPSVPDMPIRMRTMALAQELGLADKYVFFGDWVANEDWPGVLLEADVGLSLHPDTVEARLAYRSRVLDYVWAGLPMVVTRGDAAAEMVEKYGLGIVVDYGDVAAVSEGIARLLLALETGLEESYRDRFDLARAELTWEKAAQPLIRFCRQPHRAADRAGDSPVRSRAQLPTRRAECEESPMISAIVLAWNGKQYIQDCLDSLLDQDCPDLELLVVDNGSTDGTPELVSEQYPMARLIRNDRNLGFAAGNNVGLRAATGDMVALVNQDTKLAPGCLVALASTFEDASIGIAGCKLLYPDGTIQHAGGYLYGPRGESEHIGRHAADDGRFDQLADIDYATAATMAISRSALERIGPLDEGFAPAYYEDADWCYRARASGFRVVYQPRAVVTHYESVSGYPSSHDLRFALNHGRVRCLLKHRPLADLLGEFRAAETAWLLGMERSEDLMAARHAYLGNMLRLPDILAFRKSDRVEAEALMGLLLDLRAAAVAGLASVAGPGSQAPQSPADADALPAQGAERLLSALRDRQVLSEHVFASKVPVLGPAIVAFRNLWNSMASKWYGRSIMEQQSAFNTRVVQYLEEISRHLQAGSRDAAANIRELTAIAERLAELDIEMRRQRGE